jgi:hypothetical protein
VLTQRDRDYFTTVITTGFIPEETNPGPDGFTGGIQLSAAEHAALLQLLFVIAGADWEPETGQPVPGKEYENYRVQGDGTIRFTDLELAGQPMPLGDGTFGIRTVGKRGPAPKGIGGGGVDQGKGGDSSGPSVSTGSGTPTSSAGSASAATDDNTAEATSEEGTQEEVPENAGGDQ